MQEPTGVPTLLPLPQRTVCSLMTSSSHSLRFAALTSSYQSGSFDAPFSYNELVAALSRCHESSPGADGLPYSTFKVSFPWWRHLLLSSSTSSCGSPSSPPLGSPVWSSHSSSVTVTPLSLTRIVLYLSPLVLSVARWFSLGRRHSCLQPCGLPASAPSGPHFCRFH